MLIILSIFPGLIAGVLFILQGLGDLIKYRPQRLRRGRDVSIGRSGMGVAHDEPGRFLARLTEQLNTQRRNAMTQQSQAVP